MRPVKLCVSKKKLIFSDEKFNKDEILKELDLVTGEERVLPCESSSSLTPRISPNGQILFVLRGIKNYASRATAEMDVYNLTDGGTHIETFNLTGRCRNFCVSPDGKHLFVTSEQKKRGPYGLDESYSIIHVLDAENGSIVRTIDMNVSTRIGPRDLCISPDGTHLFVTMGPCDIYVIRVSDGETVQQFRTPHCEDDLGQWGICISHDGSELYVAQTYNNRIQIVKVEDGSHVRTILLKPEHQPRGMCLSPDGHELYATDYNAIYVFQA